MCPLLTPLTHQSSSDREQNATCVLKCMKAPFPGVCTFKSVCHRRSVACTGAGPQGNWLQMKADWLPEWPLPCHLHTHNIMIRLDPCVNYASHLKKKLETRPRRRYAHGVTGIVKLTISTAFVVEVTSGGRASQRWVSSVRCRAPGSA